VRCLLPLATPALLILTGCDSFYRVDAVVTDCATHEPVAGVHVTIRVEEAVGTPSPRIVELETPPDGRILVTLNQPDSVTATLTLTKSGYTSWTTQLGSRGERPLRICLARQVASALRPRAGAQPNNEFQQTRRG
jgi:hypothetical protein